MIRVALGDDHSIVRSGIKQILSMTPGIEVVAEATQGAEVLDMCSAQAIDVLLLDLNMPGISGNDLITRLHLKHPKLPILVLSMHDSALVGTSALKAGASGYVTKDSDTNILIEGIRKLAAGGRFIAPAMAQAMALHSSSTSDALPHESLSDREMEVFRRIVKGQSINAIADSLSISNKTVSTHKARVLEKMGIASTADLVRYAMDHELSP